MLILIPNMQTVNINDYQGDIFNINMQQVKISNIAV